MKAIGRAIEFEEVDILNMSVGIDHVSNPDRSCSLARATCPLCEVAKKAVQEGITIVAGAGNKPHVNSVSCPSLSSFVISVGGAVTRCEARVDSNPYGFSESLPPNALWVQREDNLGTNEIFCSGRGCIVGQSCTENSITEPWEKNVEFTDRKPGILAPAIFVGSDRTGPYLDEGTSFSTPLVTAGIVSTLEWARSAGDDISTTEIRQAIRNSGHQFENCDRNYFSAKKFANEIRRKRGLTPIKSDEFGGPIDLLQNQNDIN